MTEADKLIDELEWAVLARSHDMRGSKERLSAAKAAIRAALSPTPAAPQGGAPIAHLRAITSSHPWGGWEVCSPDDGNAVPVFAASPAAGGAREPLSTERIDLLARIYLPPQARGARDFARAIEAEHGIGASQQTAAQGEKR